MNTCLYFTFHFMSAAATMARIRRLSQRLTPFRVLHGVILLNHFLLRPIYSFYSSSDALFRPQSWLASNITPRISVLAHSTTRDSIVLESGKTATLKSRLVPLTESWNVTVWEWDEPSCVMEHYWNSQRDFSGGNSRKHLLDPFGLVSWPGSVVAARELLQRKQDVQNARVLILGAGPGVEAQAAAMLGAKYVIATDIHPTTLSLLRHGTEQAGLDNVIQTKVFDVCSEEPLAECDVMVAADVLYNEHLASHVGERCREAIERGTKILVTDSQRFTNLIPDLYDALGGLYKQERLESFTGSGVMVDEDQTYDVTVRVLAIGW